MSQQPGNSWKYLYERLPEKRFQQLCGALLAHVFPDVTCYPVGQADAGRDAVQKLKAADYVYQVKWSSKRIQDPVAWLTAAIRKEHDSILRLVEKGAARYYLLTNVAGTSGGGHGTMDRLDKALLEQSEAYGIAMTCWWQADLDARVDAAPTEIKWTYPDILAGVDAVRYVIDSDDAAAYADDPKVLLRKVIATQWHEDARVKFKQVELDSHDLSTLFIDVHATRTAAPTRARSELPSSGFAGIGGAAQYLLSTPQPFTLVRGEPGQGKSTLGQYLCQVHRAHYLTDSQLQGARRPELTTDNPRLPIRIDLRDFGAWLTGLNPFDDSEAVPKKVKRPTLGTVEMFLCHLITARSGGLPTNVAAVQDMLTRFPMLIVLDGLDEIAQTTIRTQVVKEINEFTARLSIAVATPQVIVTTRPNASQLPEPSPDLFEVIALIRLTAALRATYLRRWADAQKISGRDRRALVRTFNSRSSEPHISQLADNPMQLTILLYLMHQLGESVPASRTALYTAYMDKFLAREAAKSAQVRDNRDDLEEVTAFLGWHLQSRAESDGDKGRMSDKGIRGAINTYLFSVDKGTSHVAELFTGLTDRVWALTSKVEGYFEFDVQPVREYFAARFLWEFAGAEQPNFDPSMLLRHLVRRPYWFNTTRFYAGFARPNEVSDLVDGLAEEFEDTPRTSQARVTAWTLLADGVFRGRARAEGRAAALFTDDLSVLLVNRAIDDESVAGALPPQRAAAAMAAELLRRVATSSTDSMNPERLQLAARVYPDRPTFDEWWQPRMRSAAGTTTESTWLASGTFHQAATRLPAQDVAELKLTTPQAACAALNAGLITEPDSALERRLLAAVLAGHCSDSTTTAIGLPADLIRLCAPRVFLRMAGGDGHRVYRAPVGHTEREESSSQRTAILGRLKSRDRHFEQLQRALRFNRGQKGTTSPWGNSARTIAAHFGPCWLAADIAVIGATTPGSRFLTGGSVTNASSVPLGLDADYGRLLQDIRNNRSRSAWWSQVHADFTDPLSRATWALALIAVAHADVVREQLGLLADTVTDLPSDMVFALLASSSRIGTSDLRRQLPPELVTSAAELSTTAALMLAHHALEPTDFTVVDIDFDEIPDAGPAMWPARHDASGRMLASPSTTLLTKLADLPYDSRVPLSNVAAEIPDDYWRVVLASAGTYPRVWVTAADQELSRRDTEQALSAVADAQGWFGD